MTWLITGGAGYIGSHVVDLFLASGETTVVLDNLKSGNISRVHPSSKFVLGDITNEKDLDGVFSQFEIIGIINLAGLKSVEESARIPSEYFRVNDFGVGQLLNKAQENKVPYFIQSSSAAIYGNPDSGIAHELLSPQPISVYGESKLKAEEKLDSAMTIGDISGTSLRYFNVVGSKNVSLSDTSMNNLFPIVANSIKRNLRPQVFGGDYQTLDGSCIRDYIHVLDLARAHLLAARNLQVGELPKYLNVGTGRGHSVLEVIAAFQAFHETTLELEILPRRTGDPGVLIADTNLAFDVLGFKAEYSLEKMVASTHLQ